MFQHKYLVVYSGKWTSAGTWRVGGVLAMSRAFGNRLLKQFVIAEPEIQVLALHAYYVALWSKLSNI